MNQKIKMPTIGFALLCCLYSLKAQVTIDDYNRADSMAKFNDLVYHAAYSPNWVDSTHHVWYKIRTRKGEEYMMADADKLKKVVAFNQEKLCEQLNKQTGKSYKAYSVPLSDISFSKDLKELNFVLDSFHWKCNLGNYKLMKQQKAEKEKDWGYWGESIETDKSNIQDWIMDMLVNDNGYSVDEARAELASFDKWPDGTWFREEDNGDGYVLVGYELK